MSEQAVFDAPAYCIEVDEYGTRWYYNAAGRLHRNNGPAVEWADGDKFWYQNGQLHRIDGPAIEYSNGDKVWFINDVELTEDKYNQVVKQYE